MARQSLPLKTNRSADRVSVLTNPGAVNLQTVTKRPDFGPQRCVLIATGAASAITLTADDADNTALVFAGLPSGAVITVDAPVKAVVSSTTVILVAHWWCFPTKDDNQVGPFPLNG